MIRVSLRKFNIQPVCRTILLLLFGSCFSGHLFVKQTYLLILWQEWLTGEDNKIKVSSLGWNRCLFGKGEYVLDKIAKTNFMATHLEYFIITLSLCVTIAI